MSSLPATCCPPTADTTCRRPRWWVAALLTALVLLVHGQELGFAFLNWDEPTFILGNPYVAAPSWQHVGDLFRPASMPAENLYVPVNYLSHMVVFWLAGGFSAAAFHGVNLALHLANTLLLFTLLRRLDGRWLVALFPAAVFAVHPLQAEAVAWVIGRKDVLSTCFALLAMLAALYGQSTGRWRWDALGLLLFLLALLSKPTVVVLPLLLLGLWWWRAPARWRRHLAWLAPWFAVAAALYLVNARLEPPENRPVLALKFLQASYLPGILDGWLERLLLLARPAPIYLTTNLDPATICVAACLPLLALLGGAYVAWRRGQRAVVGVLAVAALLGAPALSIALGFNREFYTADRYGYVVVPVLALLVALVVAGLAGWLRCLATVVLVAAVAILTWQGRRQVAVWHDPGTLWADQIAQQTDHYIAHNLLAMYELEQGQKGLADTHFRRAAALRPDYSLPAFNLGVMAQQAGDQAQADAWFRRARRANPAGTEAAYALGQRAENAGREEEALRHYDDMLRSTPGHGPTLFRRGVIRQRRGDRVGARADFSAAAQALPTFAPAPFKLGMLDFQEGQVAAAEAHFRRALDLDPQHFGANFNLALLLRESGAPAHLTAARACLELAVTARPDDADAHAELGRTQAMLSQWPSAAKELERALSLTPVPSGQAPLHRDLAQVYHALGDDAKAATHQAAAAQAEGTGAR